MQSIVVEVEVELEGVLEEIFLYFSIHFDSF